MASFFNPRRDWIWLLVIPGVLVWVLGSQLDWFGGDEELKPLVEDELQFVGTWVGKNEQLELFAKGTANYLTPNEKWRGARLTVRRVRTARGERYKAVAIQLDAGGRSKVFTVNSEPQRKGGKLVIRLDGRDFERR